MWADSSSQGVPIQVSAWYGSTGDYVLAKRSMAVITLAERLISQVAWEDYAGTGGTAVDTGNSLRALLSATDPASVERAYWKLENHIVVQGDVYSAAVPATSVLVATLVDELPKPVLFAVLDLLYRILVGGSVDPAQDFVAERRERVNEGLWLVVKQFVFGPRHLARDILAEFDCTFDYESLV